MAEVQYATNGKGNLGVTLGAIGTGLGALAGAGGLAGLLGLRPGGGDPGEKPVTRYEMGLIQENNKKDNEIAFLKGQQYTDMKAGFLQQQISQQAVWNATQEGILNLQRFQIDRLYTLAKLGIPASSVTVPAAEPSTPATASH